MTETLDGLACGLDGCGQVTGSASQDRVGTASPTARLEIVSDAICPWCFVSKRRLERALTLLASEGLRFAVSWRPFQLNPDMPKEGMDRRVYRSRKFGSWERSRQLDAQVAAVGAQEGIMFRHDLIARTPNTFDAHRLVWLGERNSVQDAVVEGIFRAYFVDGRDIGDPEVLTDLGADAGMSRADVQAMLASDEGSAEVSEGELTARHLGAQGLPSAVLNGQLIFSGALRAEIMAAHLGAATRA